MENDDNFIEFLLHWAVL